MALIGKFIFSSLFIILFSTSAWAVSVGPYIGGGLPFLTQAGAHIKINDMMGVAVGYNLLDLSVDEADVSLSMPEVLFHFHPFSGSFFVAGGLGQETLEVTAEESTDSDPIKVEVDAMTTIVKVGWMWGSADDGFWFGMDVSYIIPSGSDETITAPSVLQSDPNYQDAVEAADDFGDASYPNITFARFGWLF